jgi:hypothetical protein
MGSMKDWNLHASSLAEQPEAGRIFATDKLVSAKRVSTFHETSIRPGDCVCLEGD